MRERAVVRAVRAFALASVAGAFATGAITYARSGAAAATAKHAVPIAGALKPIAPLGCVAALRDSRTGSGAKAYVSRYVTDGAYAYGQWRAGTFGGQSLWKKNGTQWCKTETGLATLDRAAIVGFGVPPANARRLIAKMHAAGDVSPATAATPLRALGRAPRGGAKRH